MTVLGMNGKHLNIFSTHLKAPCARRDGGPYDIYRKGLTTWQKRNVETARRICLATNHALPHAPERNAWSKHVQMVKRNYYIMEQKVTKVITLLPPANHFVQDTSAIVQKIN